MWTCGTGRDNDHFCSLLIDMEGLAPLDNEVHYICNIQIIKEDLEPLLPAHMQKILGTMINVYAAVLVVWYIHGRRT